MEEFEQSLKGWCAEKCGKGELIIIRIKNLTSTVAPVEMKLLVETSDLCGAVRRLSAL